MYSPELLMMDAKTFRNMQSYSKLNTFEKLMHLVGFTTEIYYDARTYERQIHFSIAFSKIFFSSPETVQTSSGTDPTSCAVGTGALPQG
jgi:hypothetical protein